MDNRIQPGDEVTVRTAFGNQVEKRAVSGVETGNDFLIVWVCSVEEWELAKTEHRERIATPWPAEDVHERQTLPA